MMRRPLSLVFTCGLAFGLVAGVRHDVASAQQRASAREAAWRENNLGVALLEQFRFADAAKAFELALEKDASLLAARVNLAIAHFYVPDLAAARQAAEAALALAPDAPQPNYLLALVARTEGRAEDAVPYLQKVLAHNARDLGANVTLGQVYLQTREFEKAAEAFRLAAEIEPYNVSAAYNLGVALTRAGRREEGQAALQRFQKLRDSAYKSALGTTYLEQGQYAEAISSSGAEADGVSTETPPVRYAEGRVMPFGVAHRVRPTLGETLTAAEAASSSPRISLVLSDLDGDGTLDAVVAGLPALRVFRNRAGRFEDVTAGAGLANKEAAAVVAGDYDNDARPDLLALKPGGLALYRNAGAGRFEDVSVPARLPAFPFVAATAAWLDIDHDGDLDVFVGGLSDPAATPADRALVFPGEHAEAPSLVLQNNGDGTFSDVSERTGLAARGRALAVVPTDFDNRRDVDLLVLRDEAPVLFKNMRDGSFRDMAVEVGLQAKGPFLCVAAGDVNKDGFSDLFLGAPRGSSLALSDGRGGFAVSQAPASSADALAAQFVDYDDDGLLDLFALTAKGPHLMRNLGGSWADVTAAAFRPPAVTEYRGAALATADLDGDGDADVLVATAQGLVTFTSEGGENRSFAVDLRGRVSNSGGVGAKLEMRAGSLRQKLETAAAVPMPAPADLRFGLGQRTAPDAVRVIWVSGIVQTETALGPNSPERKAVAITEIDRKPSSCPFLYAWNGERFEFVTDFLGAGEMGYYEAPGIWNVPNPREYVRLAPGQLVAKDGRYELRVTNELEEVLYLDSVRLLVIDHPADVEVHPNEGMTSPPKPHRLIASRDPRVPRAFDDRGRDVSERLAAVDRLFVDDLPLEHIRGYAKLHTLTLDLSALPATHTLLRLTGWTDYSFSSDNVAAHQARLPAVAPRLEVEDADGTWRTAIEQVGLPVGRPQTVVVDLAGIVGKARRVRIVTSLRVYWDAVSAAAPAADVVLAPRDLTPTAATLRERGFSAETSSTGREPWSYDYARVSQLSPWKTMPGRYTRLGDVRPRLVAADDGFVVSKPGDEIALSFEAPPPPRRGLSRTFLMLGDGFSKEMDINSASPDVVSPLPYHGMTEYPYAADRAPAAARERHAEAERWNTRVVVRPIVPLELFAAAREDR